jgi:hypothetical protein
MALTLGMAHTNEATYVIFENMELRNILSRVYVSVTNNNGLWI